MKVNVCQIAQHYLKYLKLVLIKISDLNKGLKNACSKPVQGL